MNNIDIILQKLHGTEEDIDSLIGKLQCKKACLTLKEKAFRLLNNDQPVIIDHNLLDDDDLQFLIPQGIIIEGQFSIPVCSESFSFDPLKVLHTQLLWRIDRNEPVSVVRVDSNSLYQEFPSEEMIKNFFHAHNIRTIIHSSNRAIHIARDACRAVKYKNGNFLETNMSIAAFGIIPWNCIMKSIEINEIVVDEKLKQSIYFIDEIRHYLKNVFNTIDSDNDKKLILGLLGATLRPLFIDCSEDHIKKILEHKIENFKLIKSKLEMTDCREIEDKTCGFFEFSGYVDTEICEIDCDHNQSDNNFSYYLITEPSIELEQNTDINDDGKYPSLTCDITIVGTLIKLYNPFLQ